QTLKKAGVAADKNWVRPTDWSPEQARTQMIELLALAEPPTAIFAANFLMTTGVLAALQERDIPVPQGMEVVASDDFDWLDVFRPAISAVVQPSYEMGVAAAELLFRRLKDPRGKRESIVLRPSLKVRM